MLLKKSLKYCEDLYDKKLKENTISITQNKSIAHWTSLRKLLDP
jgi:hypothetical protein